VAAVTKPGTTQPGTTQPGTTKPGTTKPDTTKPGTTKPGTTKPGTTKPDTTKPGTTKPGTTKPGTTKPGGRAAPLPPDQRRQAILDATVPLLHAHGRDVTTRQIAVAAGIAEGTIFRVFPDKESLLDDAIARAFDQEPTKQRLRAIDPALPLVDRVRAAALILADRIETMWSLLYALRLAPRAENFTADRRRAAVGAGAAGFADVLTELFAADAPTLAVTPAVAGQLLRSVVFAGMHPHIAGPEQLPIGQLVDVLLNGILRREESSC
jgi:AcrR family transcriptional regulator